MRKKKVLKYRLEIKANLLAIPIGESIEVSEAHYSVFRARMSQMKADGIGVWESKKEGKKILITRVC